MEVDIQFLQVISQVQTQLVYMMQNLEDFLLSLGTGKSRHVDVNLNIDLGPEVLALGFGPLLDFVNQVVCREMIVRRDDESVATIDDMVDEVALVAEDSGGGYHNILLAMVDAIVVLGSKLTRDIRLEIVASRAWGAWTALVA